MVRDLCEKTDRMAEREERGLEVRTAQLKGENPAARFAVPGARASRSNEPHEVNRARSAL